MIHFAPIGMTMFMLMAAAQSGGALVGERTDGVRRICSYEDRVRGRLAPPLTVSIGAGEPCPFQFPRQRRPRPGEIPALATLEGRVREGSQIICRYVYLGVRYNRPIQPSQSCPYTPSFAE